MNKWDLENALSGVDPRLTEEAAPEKTACPRAAAAVPKAETAEKRFLPRLIRAAKEMFARHKKLRIAVPLALLLALALILGSTLHVSSFFILKAYALEQAGHPENRSSGASSDEYFTQMRNAMGSGRDLADFFTESMTEILSDPAAGEHANRLYSPLNAYMALAMLAECAGGESRAEILDLLGVPDIETLREKTAAIYLANSIHTRTAKSVLYNSVWLDQSLSYREETVKTLAEKYYASSFRGEMGTEGYNRALRTWIDEATDGLLSDRLSGTGMTHNTVMALVSALNLDVKWEGFKKKNSFAGTFYAAQNQLPVTYMRQEDEYGFYARGDNFYATYVEMGSNLQMWLILPDEGTSPEALLQQETYQRLLKAVIGGELTGYEGSIGDELAYRSARVKLTLPRFDIKAEIDLKENFRRMGLTNSLSADGNADFSALTDGMAYVSDFKQTARLIANEEGVRAISFTLAFGAGKAAPLPDEITLIFNRPFLFVLMSGDSLPLYAGIVNEP